MKIRSPCLDTLTNVKTPLEAMFHLSVDFVSAIIAVSIFRVDNSDNHLIQESVLTLNDRLVLQQQISHQKV